MPFPCHLDFLSAIYNHGVYATALRIPRKKENLAGQTYHWFVPGTPCLDQIKREHLKIVSRAAFFARTIEEKF